MPPSRVRPLPKRGSSNKGGGRRALPKGASQEAARKAKPPPFACPSWEPRDHYDELDDSASDVSVPRRWLRALQPTPTSPPPSDADALFDDADSSSSSDGGPVALAASTAPCRGACATAAAPSSGRRCGRRPRDLRRAASRSRSRAAAGPRCRRSSARPRRATATATATATARPRRRGAGRGRRRRARRPRCGPLP